MRVHIVEPTLLDSRGHARSLVERVCRAGADHRFEVWADHRASAGLIGMPNVTVRPWFRRRIRVLQQFRLCRRLVREDAITCISTAGRTEIAILDAALRGAPDPQRAFLYVHWLRPTESRMRALVRLGAARPELRLGAATETVRDHLVACGFRRVTWVPYPTDPAPSADAAAPPFRHVLYAGAARMDKGFGAVVDVIAEAERRGGNMPFLVQTGGDHYGKRSAGVERALNRLRALGYPGLRSTEGGLDGDRYERQFHGAVCLQLYDREAFGDRASGVTLDAFAAGAPVVAREGTWIARQVERFDAGLVVPADDPDSVLAALDAVVGGYGAYSARARRAGYVLAEEHDPRHLVEAITDPG